MLRRGETVIFFDVGDTLIFARRTLHEAIVKICQRDGVEVEESLVRETAAAIKPTLGLVTTLDLEAFRRWWMRMYAELLRRCGYRGDIPSAQDELWGLWRSGRALRLFPDTVDTLKNLQAQRYRLAVVSNWDDTLHRTLIRLGIRPYFEEVFCSYLLGAEKPDPRLFQHALRAMNVDAQSVWHVGDSLESDVAGARSVGIRPILIDHFGRFNGQNIDVPVARSLSQVLSVISAKSAR